MNRNSHIYNLISAYISCQLTRSISLRSPASTRKICSSIPLDSSSPLWAKEYILSEAYQHTLWAHSTITTMTVPEQQGIETPPRAASPVHRFGTLAVHAGSPHDPSTGAVIESVSPWLQCGLKPTQLLILFQQDFPLHHICTDICRQSSWALRIHTICESEPRQHRESDRSTRTRQICSGVLLGLFCHSDHTTIVSSRLARCVYK